MTIGERIYELRRKNYVSQEELADFMQVSRQSVSKWETDQSYPELDKIAKLAKYFNVTTDYLLTGEESASKSEESYDTQNTKEQTNTTNLNSFLKWHYEYKSKTKIGNVPLVHINLGVGLPPRVARGIIAIGNIAQGVIAIGPIAIGIITYGALCLGLLSFGGLVLGLLAAFGGIAVSPVIAAGGIALGGYMAFGGIAIGTNSFGGIAIGDNPVGGLPIYSSIEQPLYKL
ncbi:MAG: helix-turn-helix domain-containing protein [Clostridia bacterium]|nr:helix-turn-helix domain-containing protein [Clostridia bacterium]